MILLALLACRSDELAVGLWEITLTDGALTAIHPQGAKLVDLRPLTGKGTSTVEMQLGSFRFTDVTSDLDASAEFGRIEQLDTGPLIATVLDGDGETLGALDITEAAGGRLDIRWNPATGGDRVGFSAACDADDHFIGLGSHAFDVDHVGETFALWTSEPGIGKSDSDEYPEDWFATGTRHSTSFPAPIAVRPQLPMGILLDAKGRTEVSLCDGSDRWSMVAWQEGGVRIAAYPAADPVGVIQRITDDLGRPALPPAWTFGPWNDAIRGADRVREVAADLRTSGTGSVALWTEDFKGAEETGFGYHLTGEWTVDETLYPDASGLAADLEADGFQWMAYFSPFVFEGYSVFDAAVAADVLIKNPDGTPYIFLAPPLDSASLVDLSTDAGRDFVKGYLTQALDVGFDGWMADYAEWLPTDAVLASGEDAAEVHNLYPEWWQETNAEAVAGTDAVFFVRSGWSRTAGMVPVVWAGDQRTSFDADDGLPTVVPLGLGLSAVGVPVFTHDVAGYQSLGNPATTRELWSRWAWLGAFTPVLRTHHGAFAEDNWQWDSDAETMAEWAAVCQEHLRLFPYLYGLANRASVDGTPMILPPAFVYGGDYGRIDAWLLGDSLLVAPVTEMGATGRDVELPPGVRWYDWWTRLPVESGRFEAPLGTIPVFAAAGTTVPRWIETPDTLVDGAVGLTGIADVDGAREILLFGGGGDFAEADGTTYDPSGTPTGSGTETVTLTTGDIEVAGVKLHIDGTVERTYTVVVIE